MPRDASNVSRNPCPSAQLQEEKGFCSQLRCFSYLCKLWAMLSCSSNMEKIGWIRSNKKLLSLVSGLATMWSDTVGRNPIPRRRLFVSNLLRSYIVIDFFTIFLSFLSPLKGNFGCCSLRTSTLSRLHRTPMEEIRICGNDSPFPCRKGISCSIIICLI